MPGRKLRSHQVRGKRDTRSHELDSLRSVADNGCAYKEYADKREPRQWSMLG